jgi:hypothetical protein
VDSGAAKDTAANEGVESSPTFRDDIVHETLKGLDVSFGYQVSDLEKSALRSAHDMAAAGLPRHDLQSTEPLDVELELSQRASQVFCHWSREVRRRVEAAIAKELRSAKAALTTINAALAAYRSVQEELDVLNPRGTTKAPAPAPIPAPEAKVEAEPERVEIPAWAFRDTLLTERHFGYWFWPFIIVLVGVEFLANAPVFSELFPQDAELDARMRDWLDPAAGMSWTTGVTHLLARMVTYPDAALVALGVVLFLLFLGHKAGENVRTWVALSEPHPEIPGTLAARLRRQAGWVVIPSAVGIVVTLFVLWFARDMVYPIAKTRHDQTTRSSPSWRRSCRLH